MGRTVRAGERLEGRASAAARTPGGETFHVISCPEFEPDRRPDEPKRKDAYTPRELDVIRNGVQNGESAVMIAWRLNRGVYGVRDRIRMMRRAGEL